jgi:hypothetical protein
MLSLYIILAHCIGDYLLQNDWMAQNKKKSSLICAIHSFIYCIPFIFLNLSWYQLFLIFGQHHIQDRYNFVMWYMKKTGKINFSKPPFVPWSIFIIDNIFHLIWISIVILL